MLLHSIYFSFDTYEICTLISKFKLCLIVCNFCAGVENWSYLHLKLVSLCPNSAKDSEA